MQQMKRWLATITIAAGLSLGLGACSNSQSPDDQSWELHGNGEGEQRFSTLSAIDEGNVDKLGVAWFTDIEARSLRGVEATPIVVDGVMYVTGPWNLVMAIDAVSGETKWTYDPEIPGETARKACCDVVNRGVAVADGKVITGTLDGRLIALDADNGEVVWEKITVDQSKDYTITGAPRIAGDLVMIGNGGGEYGVRGYVTAYRIDNGEQEWRFHVVPGNPADGFESPAMEKAAETWTGEWWKYGGGGTAWDSMAYDPELDLFYIGTGNGSPWNQAVRSPQGGDNLYLSSIVAVRPKTGEYVWHFQTTPEDQWDFTATQHMILADLEIEGVERKVIMQAPKNGFFYVLDRETGEFISGKEYVPVNWAKGLDPETGRPNTVAEARYSIDGKPFLGTPGPGGGHNWHPMSYNPDTGLVYFPIMIAGYPYNALKATEFEYRAGAWNTGENPATISMPEDPEIRAQIRASTQSKLIAWDPVKQEEVWSVPMATPWNGGTLSTAGNLVFHGNGEGYLSAYSAKTGEKLWEHSVSTGIVAPPITYAIDGKQFISVATGWGGIMTLNMGELLSKGAPPTVNRIVTFALDGKVDLPKPDKPSLVLDPPLHTASDEVIAAGRLAYNKNCWMCHGDTGVNNGGVPNLRYSGTISDSNVFAAFVLGGIAEERGMPNFTGYMSQEDVENVRAYMIKRANDLKENPDMP